MKLPNQTNFTFAPLVFLPALALLQEAEAPADLSLNYLIIGLLLVIAAVLGVIVVKRRQRDKDDDWDA